MNINGGSYIDSIKIGTKKDNENAEDTRTRQEIYKTIMNMISQGISSVEIMTMVTNKYPGYEKLIRSLVNSYCPISNDKAREEDGEER